MNNSQALHFEKIRALTLKEIQKFKFQGHHSYTMTKFRGDLKRFHFWYFSFQDIFLFITSAFFQMKCKHFLYAKRIAAKMAKAWHGKTKAKNGHISILFFECLEAIIM